MSKINDIKGTYEPLIGKKMFNIFVEGDKTPTKKYLKYLCDLWVSKRAGEQDPHYFVSAQVVQAVMRFESLLPYIENKDIYHKVYRSFGTLLKTLEKGEETKEERSFVREEHVRVIFENDEYLMLEPKTHKGSVKYGANTKWCTASKGNLNTYQNYMRRGFLVYLISKTKKGSNFDKLALYAENINPLSGSVLIYNQPDIIVDEDQVFKSGWNAKDWLQIILTYRHEHMNRKLIKDTKEDVKQQLDSIKGLDLNKLNQQIDFLNHYSEQDNPYFAHATLTINKLVKQIETQTNYAR
jgi:hypothetical protein